jgi:hypothetical protein
MKDRRSKRLRAFVADLERAERWTKADTALFDRLREEYPYGVREPVFCWLLVNYDQVGKGAGLLGSAGKVLPR